MPQFYPLTVTDIRKTTRDAVVVTLAPPVDADFDFVEGQYLTFRRDFDGDEVRRSYSICSGVEDPFLQVGIKRVDGGIFSSWANDQLRAGMTLEAMPPRGEFHAPHAPQCPKNYLGFAAGSGITPLLSIIKTTLAREHRCCFTLIYANSNINTIMFREELEELKNTYMCRLSLIHILNSEAQDIALFRGRIDSKKCAALFENWIDVKSITTAFICGPEPLMHVITKSLRQYGLEDAQIKFELFASHQPRPARRTASRKSASKSSKIAGKTRLQVSLDGGETALSIGRDTSILDALLAAGINAPYACKAGVCSTCKCKITSGEVEMMANHALEDYEIKRGYTLACQSFPLTEELRIIFEDH